MLWNVLQGAFMTVWHSLLHMILFFSPPVSLWSSGGRISASICWPLGGFLPTLFHMMFYFKRQSLADCCKWIMYFITSCTMKTFHLSAQRALSRPGQKPNYMASALGESRLISHGPFRQMCPINGLPLMEFRCLLLWEFCFKVKDSALFLTSRLYILS